MRACVTVNVYSRIQDRTGRRPQLAKATRRAALRLAAAPRPLALPRSPRPLAIATRLGAKRPDSAESRPAPKGPTGFLRNKPIFRIALRNVLKKRLLRVHPRGVRGTAHVRRGGHATRR